MKNSLILLFISYFFLNSISFAETFRFETSNLEIIENGKLINAGKGKVFSSDNNLEIESDKFEYNKDLNILKTYGNGSVLIKDENLKINFDQSIIDQKKSTIKASGNVVIFQIEENLIIKTDFLTYDQNNFDLLAKGNVEINQSDKELEILTNSIKFNKRKNIINSNTKTILKDKYNNIYNFDQFFYEIDKNLLKIKNVKIKDFKDNEFMTEIAYLNTETNRLFGKDISINLDNKSFNENNEPRLRGNSVINDNNSTEITKGVFTTCKKRDKCPPWQLSAKKIQHDKKRKIINYESALLKVYDLPVMYFPKFFHPDPTVKRKSGFLIPTIKNSPNSDNFLNVPYFLAIAENKDATFSPRLYTDNKVLLQTEYRQANFKSNHFLDFSYFNEKSENSKTHFFYNYLKNFNTNNFESSEVYLDIQQTSNDTYLRANKLKTQLNVDNSILKNSLNLDFYSNDFSINTETTIYEDLNKKKDSDKYEYILPKLKIVKKIDNKTNLNGDFSFKSQSLIRNYNTNIFEKTNFNDLIFNSFPKITDQGFYNNYSFILRNANSDSQNSTKYKKDANYYISGIFQYNSSLPLIKEDEKIQRVMRPKLSLKIAPDFTKDIRNNETARIDVNNIYSIDRITSDDTLEGGLSLAFGNDFSIFDKKSSREYLSLKLANNIRFQENEDLPRINQIGQKTSNIFSEISINPNDFFKTRYNMSIKNNLSEIDYENLITDFKINNFVTSFDYLNENNSFNKTSYLTNTTSYNLDESNKLIFSTRENKTSDITEYYNLMYQYKNDCLAASIEYNKDYYSDRDIKPEESIFFKLTIIPFGETTSPNLKN